MVGAFSVRMDGLIGFPAGISAMVSVSTFITGDFFNVLNAHATGEQGHGNEETDNEDGDEHQDPCDGFKPTKTEGLENTGTEETHCSPPRNRTQGTKKEMV